MRVVVALAVLHVSVSLRIVGDLVDEFGRFRAWGGLLNAVALALFVANMAGSLAVDAMLARSGELARTSP